MKELEELVLKKQSTLTIYKNYPKNKEIPLLQSKGIEGAWIYTPNIPLFLVA